MPVIASTSGRLHSEFIGLLFLQTHRETDRFFGTSGVQFDNRTVDSSTSDSQISSELLGKVGSTLTKVGALRVNLNIDGESITSRTHTHPSHSQTSRLLTLSLSLGVPVPRPTEFLRDVKIPLL
jgi:hypothetical protein